MNKRKGRKKKGRKAEGELIPEGGTCCRGCRKKEKGKGRQEKGRGKGRQTGEEEKNNAN
jgi:hypothetical protein